MCNAANEALLVPGVISIHSNSYALFTEACEYSTSQRRAAIMIEYLKNIKGTDIELAIVQMSKSKSSLSLPATHKGWADNSNKWNAPVCCGTTIASLDTSYTFEDCWKLENIKSLNTLSESHADLYRTEFRLGAAWYLPQRHDPQTKSEWNVVCLALSTVSFMWQKRGAKLLSSGSVEVVEE